jgi:hypothetical protein
LRPFALAALVWIAAVSNSWPQTAAPPPASPPLQATPPQAGPPNGPAPAPAAPESPGLIDEMGKALEKSLSVLPTLKSTGEALDDLNTRAKDAAKDAAKNAGEGLSRLTTPASIATGRIMCPVSANGASDCKVAADKLCQTKGYKEGKSLSTDSVEACSAKVLIPGRARKPDDCRTDNFVTRALCQ